MEATQGTVNSCVDILNQGNLLLILPGGGREAFCNDYQRYEVIWCERKGFAKIAVQAKAVR